MENEIYEIKIVSFTEDDQIEFLEMQKEGWEITGSAMLEGELRSYYIRIPMKRLMCTMEKM